MQANDMEIYVALRCRELAFRSAGRFFSIADLNFILKNSAQYIPFTMSPTGTKSVDSAPLLSYDIGYNCKLFQISLFSSKFYLVLANPGCTVQRIMISIQVHNFSAMTVYRYDMIKLTDHLHLYNMLSVFLLSTLSILHQVMWHPSSGYPWHFQMPCQNCITRFMTNPTLSANSPHVIYCTKTTQVFFWGMFFSL